MRILITNLLKQNSNNRIITQRHKNNNRVYFAKQEQYCSSQGMSPIVRNCFRLCDNYTFSSTPSQKSCQKSAIRMKSDFWRRYQKTNKPNSANKHCISTARTSVFHQLQQIVQISQQRPSPTPFKELPVLWKSSYPWEGGSHQAELLKGEK